MRPLDTLVPHPFTVHDLVQMARVGDPRPSPDGKWVGFTAVIWDESTGRRTTSLWLASTERPLVRQLASFPGKADTPPAWAPDGHTLAFVSGKGGSKQIWTVGVEGGEPLQLTDLPVPVDHIRWSPSGTHLSFSAEVYPETADLRATAARDKERAGNPVKAMKFDRLFIRHWDEWSSGKRNHVFVVRVAQPDGVKWVVEGEPVDLMKGMDGDCPSRPFGSQEEYSWSPDGKEISFTSQLGQDEAWSTDLNIFVVPVTGGLAKCITLENQATDTQPAYSPDGTTIAYLAMARPGFESDRRRVKLYDRATGETRVLTEGWDKSPASLAWSHDSSTLFTAVPDRARKKVYAVEVTSGTPSEIIGEHHNSGVVVAVNEKIVFGQDSLMGPGEIWTAKHDGTGLMRLTHFNDENVKRAAMSSPDEFYFPGHADEPVHAWILKPVGFVEGRKYPVAFVIHGGPQSATEDTFHYRWNLQTFAGAGYAVVAVNFHGSIGFGQAFTDSISGDWGGKPFEDLMKGLDKALASYAWLDSERVAGLGPSFGGWMINWINGHSDRFKCLVNHDGGFDEFSGYFTTEELWFPEWEYGGTPWVKPDAYDRFSPSRYVANWKTPTLVIHGAKDYRLVDSEGIATFTALQRRGIPSELLYFPDEGHWVLEPHNSIVWNETVIAWLDRWLKQGN